MRNNVTQFAEAVVRIQFLEKVLGDLADSVIADVQRERAISVDTEMQARAVKQEILAP